MVTATAGLESGAAATDEFDADSEVIADSSDASAEAEPQKEVDPIADLRAQLGGAARRDELESLRNQVRSELGRSQRLEARLDALAGANPLADVDPRLDANENLLTGIADALIDSELTDDRMKGTLRAARSALDAAKGARAQGRMREELKADILKALPQPASTETHADNPWAQATADVIAEIKDRLPDFDPNTIPKTVWDAGSAKGSPARAVAHVIRWAEQQAEEPAASRTATRRQAAGVGSPARSAGVVVASASDNDEAYNTGAITHEQYKANRSRLGLSVEPGGGR